MRRPHASRRAHAGRYAAALALVGLLGAGCTASGGPAGSGPQQADGADQTGQQVGSIAPMRLSTNVSAKRGVAVDTVVKAHARDGQLDSVRLSTGGASLDGTLRDDGVWVATSALEPGTRYRLVMTGVDQAAEEQTERRRFRTAELTLDQQTYPSFLPERGSAVGVGMPVIVRFDLPVQRRAAVERHLSVQAKPATKGSWHWYSDTEVHYRPKTYWTPGTKVRVGADINSVDVGNGIYGQESRVNSFTVGDSVVSHVNLRRHELGVDINGKRVRTIPISGGMPGHESRSGTKVIIEKFDRKRMDAATTGVSPDDPDYYNIANVQYAMRVTYSGEFLHAAPWSVGSQGSANVSHGCIGMSTSDARWLYERSSIGDVVVTTGSDRTIEPGNGWTDWDVSFADYKQGSALS